VPRLTIAGGFAKLVKLAQGAMFLHSSKSRVDMAALAGVLETLGAPADLVAEAASANTAAQVLAAAAAQGLPLANAIAGQARAVAVEALAPETDVEVMVFDRQGALAGRAAFGD
jgi:cobalt-precorrin-5B (C1)-methyltransferase